MSLKAEHKANIEQLLATLDSLDQANLSAQDKASLATARQQAAILAAALVDAQARAEESQQGKTKFVSVVTHELRLPLTSIKGYTDLLRQGIAGPVNEQQANFLNVVRNNVDRMSTLISDLSDMSHIQTGRLKLQPTENSISLQFNEFLAAWKERMLEKKQSFSIEIDPAIPPFVFDANRLKQVLGYLLNNAHCYTGEGGTIALRVEPENDRLKFSVQDTGIGISPEDQEKLFTPFFRSEDNAVRELPGWGLSIHVAKLLVDLMQGEIGAHSQLGKGSTFWFTLPTARNLS
jgi:signal transduction histidine kinase